MKLLAIDYGQKKMGLAVATTAIAEPYKVIRFETLEDALAKLKKEIRDLEAETIVVGVSEGRMAEETREFAGNLEKELGVQVEFQDETLSTQIAQEMSIQAHIKRKKRREMEDAYSAALILQAYIDQKI